MKDKPVLTNKDHKDMDAFLGAVLDDYKAGVIDKSKAISGLAHVMAALDLDNYAEARAWFEQGRKFIRERWSRPEHRPTSRTSICRVQEVKLIEEKRHDIC